MIRYVAACLLGLTCLLTRPATAQVVEKLPPRVVRLEAGDTVHEPWVAMDTATYYGTRRYEAALTRTQAGCQVQVQKAQRYALTQETLRASLVQELARQRAASDEKERQWQAQEALLQKALTPPKTPLLLNPVFYEGLGAGTALGFILHFFAK